MPPIHSKTIELNGQIVELHYINTLAYRLGRTPQTIRKWEISGVIPKSMFRDKAGRRMYSDAEIAIIEKIAEETNIKQGLSISHTAFSRRVKKELEAYREKYYRKGDSSNG